MMAGRRFAVYFAWSRPREYAIPIGQELPSQLGVLEDRYPTLFEFRRATWPAFERLKDAAQFNQSIAGFFDHVILPDFDLFRTVVKDVTGNEVSVIQREIDAQLRRGLDDDLFRDIDTLIVISLDHDRTGQSASASEIQAIREFLGREERCLIICPHHDIGCEDAVEAQWVEHSHHGDGTIPGRQRLGGFARSILKGLGVPVQNRYGLSPAQAPDGGPAPLLVNLDFSGAEAILRQVATFNLHPHLPHLTVSAEYADRVEVLARQRINPLAAPHPFTDAGNRHFDALLRVRPDGLVGTVLVCDATLWSSAFGGLEGLRPLWKNLAELPT